MTEESKETAIRRARAFYQELERLLKRFAPSNFGPFIASTLHQVLKDQNQWAIYPPHMLVNAIEANCAYFRGHRDLQMTHGRLHQILNHYKDYYDPYIKHVLRELRNIDLFALAMSREQFDLQRTPNLNDFARTLLLYEISNPVPNSSSLFQDHTGVSVNDWIYMCLAIQSHVLNRSNPLIHPDNYINSPIPSVPRNSVPPFLKQASTKPKEIGDYFRGQRDKYPPHLHIFIKSAFFSTPLIEYEDGQYLVVHPYLIFYYADQGIYDTCSSLNQDVFAHEFGDSFEKYAGCLLAEFFPKDRIFPESMIQAKSEGRVCDYLVDADDCIILIECKATRYSSDLLTENAVLNDNSTGKIADAYEQIIDTAKRVRKGDFKGQLADNSRPIIAFVTMYGELYFANSLSYFGRFISMRLDKDLLNTWPSPLMHPPQILKIDTLERFLIIMRERKVSPCEMIDEKKQLPYSQAGDWPSYLGSISEGITDWSIGLLEDTAQTFFRDVVGLP